MKKFLILLGTLSTACSDSTAPDTFSAQYTLAAVQPSRIVSFTSNTSKSVLTGCMEAQSGGTLIQAVVYSNSPAGTLTEELTTWRYHIEASEIVVADPDRILMRADTAQIGSASDATISTYRVLKNDGMPTTRTLVFDKVGGLGSECGSTQWRGF